MVSHFKTILWILLYLTWLKVNNLFINSVRQELLITKKPITAKITHDFSITTYILTLYHPQIALKLPISINESILSHMIFMFGCLGEALQ